MQYAVIRTGGKQYRVDVGDDVVLDKIDGEKNKPIIFDDVLLLVKDEKVIIGKPSILGAKVSAKFIEDRSGEKIYVRKFKAKSRYRRKIGFRAKQTVLKIEKIDYKGVFLGKDTAKPTKTAHKKSN
ncbi:MAG: 50S ribosomal protein L21 [Candidatus Levybacteria bacterium RIFCSPLOWO2_01_FULL_39_10]|nr:MAG: 50S ribosomal protein L21 [Candidatus Levybacteria bacterium RIFCSPLOWO2_01_FULL_39_10]